MILAALQRLHRQKLFLLIDHNFQFLETRFYSATPVPNDEVVRQSRTVARNEQLLQQHPITGEPLNKINYAPSEGVAPIPIQLNNPLVESAAQDALTQQAKMKAQFAMHGMAEQERARRIAENTPSSPVSDSLLPPNQ